MLASVIFAGASQILSDASHDRWTAANLLTYLNQARRRIVEMRYDEFQELRTVKLEQGVKQAAPSDCAVLVAVTRNMGSDGVTPGTTINLVDRESLDAFDRSWMGRTGAAVNEYMHKPGTKTFLVNPGVPASPDVYVEVELAAYLTDLTQENGSETVGIPDEYEMAMVYWICHQAFAEDTEASSSERSVIYYKAFMTEMGNDQSQ